MKHSELVEILNQDPEYVEAVAALQLHFEIADAILRARLRKGWSQAQLAEAVGTKQANISRIEAAQSNPTLTLLNRIFRALDLRVSITEVQNAQSLPTPAPHPKKAMAFHTVEK